MGSSKKNFLKSRMQAPIRNTSFQSRLREMFYKYTSFYRYEYHREYSKSIKFHRPEKIKTKLKSEECKARQKETQRSCFPVSIAMFLRTPILKNICERLLLPL